MFNVFFFNTETTQPLRRRIGRVATLRKAHGAHRNQELTQTMDILQYTRFYKITKCFLPLAFEMPFVCFLYY